MLVVVAVPATVAALLLAAPALTTAAVAAAAVIAAPAIAAARTEAASTRAAADTAPGAAATIRGGTCFVNPDGAMIHHPPVERLAGLVGQLIGLHLDKREALTGAGFAVGDQRDRRDRPDLGEQFAEFCLRGLVAQIPDIKFLAHENPFEKGWRRHRWLAGPRLMKKGHQHF